MEINKKLLKDIIQYCNLNEIENIEEEINKYIQIGFNVIRFGTAPFQEYQEEVVIKKQKTVKNKKEEIISEKLDNIQEEIKTETLQPIEEEIKPKKKIRIIKNK